jgi:casein kinase 1
MISRIEFMHAHYYIHRDIKPENFLIGIGKKSTILHLIDFGLTKKFVEKYNHHIQYKEGKKLVGTARYVSVNTLNGAEQSRRDDIEALGYVLVYLLKGSLPWQGLPGATKEEKYKSILKKKIITSLEEVCLGLPSEFMIFINYSKTLRFEEKPDYSYLRRLFKELMQRENLVNDGLYDWVLPRNSKSRNSIRK